MHYFDAFQSKNILKNNRYCTPKHLEVIPVLIYFYLKFSFIIIIINMGVRVSLRVS